MRPFRATQILQLIRTIISMRLVPTGAVPPPYRRGAGGRQASGRERAGWISPGGSRRYRPALARVGRRAGARGGRERGGVLASACAGERGGAGVTWHVSIGPRGLSVELAVI
jgi:hypothetical protein